MAQSDIKTTTRPGRPGKVRDPLFLLMVVAMTLAVASSIALRAFVPGMGPSSARAESVDVDEHPPLSPLPHPATTQK